MFIKKETQQGMLHGEAWGRMGTCVCTAECLSLDHLKLAQRYVNRYTQYKMLLCLKK